MKTRMLGMLSALALLSAFAMVGCAHEGPAQKAGRHIDNAARDVKHDLKR